MKVLSLNVGTPREVTWDGRTVRTGIFKTPVPGRVQLRRLNFDGDAQADLRVHGGPHKAVYCYQLRHYDYWRAELPDTELPFGMFGENLTIDGPGEDQIYVGDEFSIGSAAVVVAQPRLPCYKLGIKFQSDDMVRRFLAAGRTGFYLAVTREGDVGAGDDLIPIARDPNAVPVSEITRLYVTKRYNDDDVASVQRLLRVAAVPDSWKDWFREHVPQRLKH